MQSFLLFWLADCDKSRHGFSITQPNAQHKRKYFNILLESSRSLLGRPLQVPQEGSTRSPNLHRSPRHWNNFSSNIHVKLFNHSHPHISRHILHTVLNAFPKVKTGRICLNIKSFFSRWLFTSFSWPQCLIQGWYCKEKLDVSHS